MQWFKRTLCFGGEIGVLLLALVLSFAVIAGVAQLSDPWLELLLPVAGAGPLFAIAVYCRLRRTFRRWMFELAVEDYERERVNRLRHPVRTMSEGRMKRVLIWAPSVIAGFVLFFLPIATHIPYLGSGYLAQYRIPIPWTVEVHSLSAYVPGEFMEAFVRNAGIGRYGAVFLWERQPLTSVMSFGSDPDEHVSSRLSFPGEEGIEISQRSLRLRNLTLTCQQFRWTHEPELFSVRCQTPLQVRTGNFYAYFTGREGDLPLFYSTLSGITRRQ